MTDKEILQKVVDGKNNRKRMSQTFNSHFLFIGKGKPAEETAFSWILPSTQKENIFQILIIWIIRYLLTDELKEAKKINDFAVANYNITTEDLKDAIKKVSTIYSKELDVAFKYYQENK